jgi:hypothetical protein
MTDRMDLGVIDKAKCSCALQEEIDAVDSNVVALSTYY